MKVAMEWTLDRRSENPESPKTVSEKNDIPLEYEECRQFLDVLNRKNGSRVKLKKLMPKFLKITSPGRASPVQQLMRFVDSRFSCHICITISHSYFTRRFYYFVADSDDDDYASVKKEVSPYVDVVFELEQASNSAGVWWNAIEAEPDEYLQRIDNVTRNHSAETKTLIIYTFNDKMFPPGLLSLISGKGWVLESIEKNDFDL